MSWTVTLVISAVAIAIIAFCGWRGSRPVDLSRGPRMFPYTLVMMISAAVLLMTIVHMVNLSGTSTGPQDGYPKPNY